MRNDELKKVLKSSFIIHHSSLIRPVVRVLHVDAEVFRLELSNDFLQGVAVAAGDADGVALNRGLDFELRLLDELNYLFGLLRGDALLDGYVLADGAAGRGFDAPVGESLERHAAPNELLLEDVVHVAQLGLVLG